MSDDLEQLTPVFVPVLSAVLLNAEGTKGEPLTYDEVIDIRDKAACIMMRVDDVERLAESRGYQDIDAENCWHEWQMLRRELSRTPDLDPGPMFNQVKSSDSAYQETIRDARNSLDDFRSMLPPDGSSRMEVLVKMEITDSGNAVFMWVSNTRMEGSNFIAELFEVPVTFNEYSVGDVFQVTPESLLDWMVNVDGILHGGFSIRCQRSRLAEDEHPAYDAHIGITEYA